MSPLDQLRQRLLILNVRSVTVRPGKTSTTQPTAQFVTHHTASPVAAVFVGIAGVLLFAAFLGLPVAGVILLSVPSVVKPVFAFIRAVVVRGLSIGFSPANLSSASRTK